MTLILTYILTPGIFIGLPILDTICKIESNNWFICSRDHGSATSTGEFIFTIVGNVILYGAIIAIIIWWKRRKIKKHIA